ncbi:MAG: sensor histidine kinase [Syntrophorhabdaceae bacterium]|nr:sensor histidine kinase [Syntrophorhabdaceae bacterium]
MSRKDSLIDLFIHDLTGPLSIASTSLHNIIEKEDKYGPISEQQRKALHMALRNVNKAQTFLKEIIEMYKSEEGLFKRDRCSIRHVLKESIIEALEILNPPLADQVSSAKQFDEFLKILEENGIKVEIKGKYDSSYFYHDEKKLQQILRNLITNALKYRRAKANISISGETDLIIKVEDDGYGIPQEKQKGIFKRFSLLKEREYEEIKGLGFGLSCVKTIVEMMNGTLTLSSEEGVGTCFTVNIPQLKEI